MAPAMTAPMRGPMPAMPAIPFVSLVGGGRTGIANVLLTDIELTVNIRLAATACPAAMPAVVVSR